MIDRRVILFKQSAIHHTRFAAASIVICGQLRRICLIKDPFHPSVP